MSAAFDLLAVGLRRKDLALKIAREAVQGRPITPALLAEFAKIDAEFSTEQIRLTDAANKPRPRSRF